jgi:hypothetical protein
MPVWQLVLSAFLHCTQKASFTMDMKKGVPETPLTPLGIG